MRWGLCGSACVRVVWRRVRMMWMKSAYVFSSLCSASMTSLPSVAGSATFVDWLRDGNSVGVVGGEDEA